jgi:hypothetical protein
MLLGLRPTEPFVKRIAHAVIALDFVAWMGFVVSSLVIWWNVFM